MSTQQHLDAMQLAHLLVVDGGKAVLVQTLHLHAIVYNVAKAIELGTVGKLFLGLLYGCGYTEAESTALVYFYCQIFVHIVYFVVERICSLLGDNLNGNLRQVRIVGYHEHTRFRACILELSLVGCNL